MLTRLLTIGTLTVVLLASHANADIMHWFWEVQVNGQAVDATVPVVVGAGDQVDIELWAEFDPYREGFAAAVFAIGMGDHFFAIGDVSIDPLEGYGLNPDLLALGDNGVFADGDENGIVDTIDAVTGFQLARGWGGNFDPSDPIRIYRLAWSVEQVPTGRIELYHGATLDGVFSSSVYDDDFGTAIEYPTTFDILVIVPAPPVSGVFILWICVARQYRR